MSAVRAVIFDFNGTISDDEPLLDRLFQELLAARGITLTSEVYLRELAGLSDPEIVRRALTLGGVEPTPERCSALLREKIDRYKAATTASPTISAVAAEAVRVAASRVPVAIASGAVREEVSHVLALAGLSEAFGAIVCIDDVARGKPDPEGFELALARLDVHVAPADVLVVEDANAGVAAARAAGMRVAAVRNPALTTTDADVVIDALTPDVVRGLLGAA